jgi:hypothetical protein
MKTKLLYLLGSLTLCFVMGCKSEIEQIRSNLLEADGLYRFDGPDGKSYRYWTISDMLLLDQIEKTFPYFLMRDDKEISQLAIDEKSDNPQLILDPSIDSALAMIEDSSSDEEDGVNEFICNIECQLNPLSYVGSKCGCKTTSDNNREWYGEYVDIFYGGPIKCEIVFKMNQGYAGIFDHYQAAGIGPHMAHIPKTTMPHGVEFDPIRAWTLDATPVVQDLTQFNLLNAQITDLSGKSAKGMLSGHLIEFSKEEMNQLQNGPNTYHFELEDKKTGKLIKVKRTFNYSQGK